MEKDIFKDLHSTQEIAQMVKLSIQRIGNLKAELIKIGLARRIGKLTIWHKDAAEWILSREDRRGKYKRKTDV